MKKLILSLLAIAGLVSAASQGAFAKTYTKNNFDGGANQRVRGTYFADGNATPATNDDFAIQFDFQFPSTMAPLTNQLAFGVHVRTGVGNTAASTLFNGYPVSPAYVGVEIYPPNSSDTANGPFRYDLVLSDGSALFHIATGLTVTGDGLTTIDSDYRWHRVQFLATGTASSVAGVTLTLIIDGITFYTITGNHSFPVSSGGNFGLLWASFGPGPAGHNAALDHPQIDNVRTATTIANLATAPLYVDNYDSYIVGAQDNGNNGNAYQLRGDNGTSQTTSLDNNVANGGSAQVTIQGINESDFGTQGCIFLNQTAIGQNYNIVALDYTAFNNDATDNIVDIKYPAALSAAQANSLGVVGFITQRLVGGIGAHNVANNNPGVEFSVSVTAGGFYKFDIVQRAATGAGNVSNTVGTSLGSFTSTLPFDHKWHRWEARINATNIPAILWDGVVVLTGTTAGAGRSAAAAAGPTGGGFVGGTNAGPVPITTPATLPVLNLLVSAAAAPDEFFAVGQYMTGVTTAAQNIRWDNICVGNPATAGTRVARLDNISSYSSNSATGVVANNTALRNSTTLADPWYTLAVTGGSNPAQWAIDTTDNSDFGVKATNAVQEFYVY